MDDKISNPAADEALRALLATRSDPYAPVQLNGAEWKVYEPSYRPGQPELSRDVAAGRAKITRTERAEKPFCLQVSMAGWERVTLDAVSWHDDLAGAAAAAEAHQWQAVEHLGRTWYYEERGYQATWLCYFGPGHSVAVTRMKESEDGFSVEHELSPRWGETYVVTCRRYASGGAPIIATFEEAAAVAMTLPLYVAALMTQATPAPVLATPGAAGT